MLLWGAPCWQLSFATLCKNTYEQTRDFSLFKLCVSLQHKFDDGTILTVMNN